MLKKALMHWQRAWWRYAVGFALLAALVVTLASIAYPPLLVSLKGIKSLAVLNILSELPASVATPIFCAVAATTTACATLVLRIGTGLLCSLYSSVKQCVRSAPDLNRLDSGRVTFRKQKVITVSGSQLADQARQINRAWDKYGGLLAEVEHFNMLNPKHVLDLREFLDFKRLNSREQEVQGYDRKIKLLRQIYAKHQKLLNVYQASKPIQRKAQLQRGGESSFWLAAERKECFEEFTDFSLQ